MTPPKVPFPSPTSKLRPRVDATVPDCLTMGVSDTPPCCAAHAPEGGGAPLDRDLTAPPLHFTGEFCRARNRRVRLGRLGRFPERGEGCGLSWDPSEFRQARNRRVRLVRLVRFRGRGGACGL